MELACARAYASEVGRGNSPDRSGMSKFGNWFRSSRRLRAVTVKSSVLLLLSAPVAPFTPAFPSQNPDSRSASQTPDNSATNRPGNTPDATRADQQGLTASDREIARKIRKAVVADKSLSVYAHNVKIISRNG